MAPTGVKSMNGTAEKVTPVSSIDSMITRAPPSTIGLTCLGSNVDTEFVAETELPTDAGIFRLRAYRSKGHLRSHEPTVLIAGNVEGKENVYVRVHDQCVTSEVFGSLKCDCKHQLEYAKDFIQQKSGAIVYLPQEGRGIGLANKVHAYALQSTGLDTVDANRHLGFADDYRSYENVEHILKDLRIQSIQLLTNNPRKIDALRRLGIRITTRVPIVIKPGEHSRQYLHTKSQRMQHHYTVEELEN